MESFVADKPNAETVLANSSQKKSSSFCLVVIVITVIGLGLGGWMVYKLVNQGSGTGEVISPPPPSPPIQPTPVVVGGFCGISLKDPCVSSEDCATGGCSVQYCGGSGDTPGIVTDCQWRNCYQAEDYRFTCGCFNGQCQWSPAIASRSKELDQAEKSGDLYLCLSDDNCVRVIAGCYICDPDYLAINTKYQRLWEQWLTDLACPEYESEVDLLCPLGLPKPPDPVCVDNRCQL